MYILLQNFIALIYMVNEARELGLRKLKIATWNLAGLCSDQHKPKEISEVLNRVKVDIVAGQETWERNDKVVNVDGYVSGLESLVLIE